jgi:hypothetical protein
MAPMKLAVTTGTTPVPMDFTGLKIRAQFRTYDTRYSLTQAESALLLSLDSDDDPEIYIDDVPTLGFAWLALTLDQIALLNATNTPGKLVAVGFEIYDDSTDPETVPVSIETRFKVDPEIVRASV